MSRHLLPSLNDELENRECLTAFPEDPTRVKAGVVVRSAGSPPRRGQSGD